MFGHGAGDCSGQQTWEALASLLRCIVCCNGGFTARGRHALGKVIGRSLVVHCELQRRFNLWFWNAIVNLFVRVWFCFVKLFDFKSSN